MREVTSIYPPHRQNTGSKNKKVGFPPTFTITAKVPFTLAVDNIILSISWLIPWLQGSYA